MEVKEPFTSVVRNEIEDMAVQDYTLSQYCCSPG